MNQPYKSYEVPISCKGIVFENGKVWLRKNERNEWELPGGKLDKGEQPEQTVAREMLEELGVKVAVKQVVHNYLYIIQASIDETRGVLVASYACEFIERTGGLEDVGEAGKAEFAQFSIEEVDSLEMPDFYRQAIKNATYI